VVRSLQGLDNYDRVEDLLRRLDELPPDLKDLYEHMLGQMIPSYRREASKLLQVIVRSHEVQTECPLDLLQLSYAE
jgi:hypothetical protein